MLEFYRKLKKAKVWKCPSVNLVCLTGESHYQRCERPLQVNAGMYSANAGHFEHLMY